MKIIAVVVTIRKPPSINTLHILAEVSDIKVDSKIATEIVTWVASELDASYKTNTGASLTQEQVLYKVYTVEKNGDIVRIVTYHLHYEVPKFTLVISCHVFCIYVFIR